MKIFLDNDPSIVSRETMANQVPCMFCPASVSAMKSDLVKKIASPSEVDRLQRKELTQKLGSLEALNLVHVTHSVKRYRSSTSRVKCWFSSINACWNGRIKEDNGAKLLHELWGTITSHLNLK